MNFIAENYVWFIVIGVVILMAVIGYIADKTDFGRQKNNGKSIEKKPKKVKDKYSEVYSCQCCGYILIHKDETGWFCGERCNYCPKCGQAIQWENLEEMEDDTSVENRE